jgi:hypothetical protein
MFSSCPSVTVGGSCHGAGPTGASLEEDTMSDDELRMVLYSHDSQGLGHTRRNLALAGSLAGSLAQHLPALTGRPVTGMLLTGIDAATSYGRPEGFDWVVLPGIRKGAGGYAPRNLSVDMTHLTALRSGMVDAALTGFRPHLVVVDRHAWGVDRELLEPLRRLRAQSPGTVVVLGLREVLDEPAAAAREWAALGYLDTVRDVYNQIWVYGDRAVHDPVASGGIPAALADLVRHTGYLATGRAAGRRTSGVDRPYVLTMAGGGSDGHRLTPTAARARVPYGRRRSCPAGRPRPRTAGPGPAARAARPARRRPGRRPGRLSTGARGDCRPCWAAVARVGGNGAAGPENLARPGRTGRLRGCRTGVPGNFGSAETCW